MPTDADKKIEQAVKRAAQKQSGKETLTDEELAAYKERGKQTLAVAEIDKKDVKKAARSLAMEATEQWEKSHGDFTNKEKKPEEKELTRAAKIGRAILDIPLSIPKTVAHSVRLSNYYQTIKKSIGETGNLGAGELAVAELDYWKENKDGKKKNIVKNVQDDLDGLRDFKGDDDFQTKIEGIAQTQKAENDAVVERMKFAAENEGEDVGAQVQQNDERERAIHEALVGYAKVVAGTRVNKHGRFTGNAGKNVAQAEKEMREEVAQAYGRVNKHNRGGLMVGNTDEIINQAVSKINTELSGVLAGDLKAKGKNKLKKQEEAVKALDNYVAENFSVVGGTAEVGLAAKEAYAKLKDKYILQYGILIGSVVSVAPSIAKSKVISTITNSSLVGWGLKTATAAVLGGITANRTKLQAQRAENIKRALNFEDGEVEKRSETGKFGLVSSSEMAKKIDEMARGGITDKKSYGEAIDLLAEMKLRNQIQNEKHIQLIGYQGRNGVERAKLDLFKSMAELKKAAMQYGASEKGAFGKEEIEFDIQAAMAGDSKDCRLLNEEVGRVVREQKKERRKAAVKGALVAGAAAGVLGFLTNRVAILDEVQKLKSGELAFKGLNVVETGAATGSVINGATETETLNDAEKAETLKDYKDKPVLIEDDPDGGVAIGIDKDGDGVIDADEYIFGNGVSDGTPGVDLTKDQDFEKVSNTLRDYEIRLDREAISTSKYGETTISEYLNSANNAVDTSGGVDWSRSATRVAFGTPVVAAGDSMDSYEVPVWGVDGGGIPDGAKLLIDFDGDGPGKALEYTIENGKAIVPASVLDTSAVGNGGVAEFIGTIRVGAVDGNTVISYATAFGKDATLSDSIMATTEGTGYAFTAISEASGEKLSQFAVDSNNDIISNMSEIFNGIEVGSSDRLPSVFAVNDIGDGQSDLTLASGETIKDFDVSGGYHAEFDAFENTPFKASDTYLGTAMTWDANGDGIMSAAEEASYIKQLIVRTATNPYMLGQNASNYGILEPSKLSELGISNELLQSWGIIDGVIDSENELNLFLSALKENPDYWDKIANATINEMETQLQGGGFEVSTVTDRLSTYANSNRLFDTANASTLRTVLYPYKVNSLTGEREYVGNVGWWCRKYGAEGGKVGDLPLCEQKSITVGGQTQVVSAREEVAPEVSTPSNPTGGTSAPEPSNPTPTTPTTPTNLEPDNPTPTPTPEPTPEPTPTPTPTPEPEPTPSTTLTPKNPEVEVKNAGEGVVPEYVQTPASELSQSQYEVNAENLAEHTISTDESAARAAQAAADAASAAQGAAEAEQIANDLANAAQTGGQEAVNDYKADLFNQFLEGEGQ